MDQGTKYDHGQKDQYPAGISVFHRSLSWEVRAKELCGQSRIEIRESDSGFRGFREGSCLCQGWKQAPPGGGWMCLSETRVLVSLSEVLVSLSEVLVSGS